MICHSETKISYSLNELARQCGLRVKFESAELAPLPECGTFTDPRDGRTYKTVKIGRQIWLAENLAFDLAGSKVYGNNPANLAKYGRLYDWETAKKACPPGWHLPTNEDWDELVCYADGTSGTDSPYDSPTAGKHLKATSGWYNNGNGTDDFGFSALPGGYGNSNGYFNTAGNYGRWWSASEYNSYYAYSRRMDYSIEDVIYNYRDKGYLYSVRCLQDCGVGNA